MMSPAMSEQKINNPLIVMRTAGSPRKRTMQLLIQRGATTKHLELQHTSDDSRRSARGASPNRVQKTAAKHTQFSRTPGIELLSGLNGPQVNREITKSGNHEILIADFPSWQLRNRPNRWCSPLAVPTRVFSGRHGCCA